MERKFTLSIEKSGIIQCENKASSQVIGRYHGRYRLGPSTSSILVLERDSKMEEISFGENSLIKRVMFSGIIADGTLLEFFNFLGENNRNGVLVILSNNIKNSIFFKGGHIRFSTSTSKENRLGEIFFRFGMVTKADLVKALSDKSMRLGERLIKNEVINIADLYKAIKLQIEEICYSSFLFQDGSFYFYELVNDDLIPSNINIPIRHILFEGVRRMDEMTYFKKKLPSPEVVLAINPDASVTGLTEIEVSTFKMIDGKSSLRDLSRKNGLGLFETTKIVFNFLQAGYIKIKSVTAYITHATSSVDSTTKLITAYNKVFDYIGKKSGKTTLKLQQDLTTFFQKFEGELGNLFKDVEVNAKLQVDTNKILSNVTAVSADVKVFSLLYKAFDEIFYFLIFSSGITLEPKIEEQLTSVVSKISESQ
jgi:Domain of unknown function (DUF4388)